MFLIDSFLLALHLISVNLAIGGPLVCIWLQFRGRSGDALATVIGKRLANASLVGYVVALAIGFVLGGFMWLDSKSGLRDVLYRFPASAYWNAVGELVFSLVCLGLYVTRWDAWGKRSWLHASLAVLSSTNLLYHFPPLMSSIGSLAARPGLVSEDTLARPLVRQFMLRPEVVSQTVHFLFATIAVTGVALMALSTTGLCGALRRTEPTGEASDRPTDEPSKNLTTAGARIALVPTVLQLLVGLWVFAQLPRAARDGLIGNDITASLLLGGSLVAAFGLMHALASVALGDTARAQVRRATWLILVVVALMSAASLRGRWLVKTAAEGTAATERGGIDAVINADIDRTTRKAAAIARSGLIKPAYSDRG